MHGEGVHREHSREGSRDAKEKGVHRECSGERTGHAREKRCPESTREMHGKGLHGECGEEAGGAQAGPAGVSGDAGGAPEVREGCRGVQGSRAPFTSSGSAGSPFGAARRSARSLPPAEQGRLRGGGSRPAPHIAPPACSAAAPRGKPRG